jgi:hypothetical protein
MATSNPAKAPPLYERQGAKSTAHAALNGLFGTGYWLAMRITVALLIAALAACRAQPESRPPRDGAATAPAAPAPQPAAKAVSLDEESELLNWHLAYPAEVAAIPALAALIRDPAVKSKAELLELAGDDKAAREKDGYEFHGYESSTDARVAGDTPRLLSLAIDVSDYSGGAHPNYGTKALLWDRKAARAVAFLSLFEHSEEGARTVLGEAYCSALDKLRAEKRQGEDREPGASDDPFYACPKFAELALIPQDKAGSGTFSSLLIHADPYVAGPYAEGDYDVELPVTAALVAALKPEYRASFVPR